MLQDFFEQLPAIHTNSNDSENCLGSAMQAALQLVVCHVFLKVFWLRKKEHCGVDDVIHCFAWLFLLSYSFHGVIIIIICSVFRCVDYIRLCTESVEFSLQQNACDSKVRRKVVTRVHRHFFLILVLSCCIMCYCCQ